MKPGNAKHHRRSIRLKGFDHASPGAYFITLVAWHRQNVFGTIYQNELANIRQYVFSNPLLWEDDKENRQWE